MKSRIWIIIALLILILSIVWWCNSPKTEESRQKAVGSFIPGIQVTSVTINEIGNEYVKMDTRILLDNPLIFNINTKRIRFQVYIDSVQVLENEYNEPIIIQSGETSVIELPIEIHADALSNVWKHFKDNNIDSAEYSINAVMEVDIPVAGEKEIKMNFSRRLPVLILPDVEIKKLDLNLLQIRKKGIDVLLSVYNPNSFEIHIVESKINFYLDDYFVLRRISDSDILLPAGKSIEITLNANSYESKLFKTGWEVLTRKDAPFSFHFGGIMRSENKMLNESKMKIIINGRLDELRKLMKR